METTAPTQKINVSYPDGSATSEICIRGLSDQADGDIVFFSPLVAVYLNEAINCYNNGCFFGTIALAQAAVEHAIAFELNGGNPEQKRESVKLPKAGRKYISKVDKFCEVFPAMKLYRKDIRKLYSLYRNTWLHGITGNIKIGKSRKPGLGKMGVEEIVCDSGQHKRLLGYQTHVWHFSEESPDGASIISKELGLVFASEVVAKDSLIIAAQVLRNISHIYQPI